MRMIGMSVAIQTETSWEKSAGASLQGITGAPNTLSHILMRETSMSRDSCFDPGADLLGRSAAPTAT